MTEATDEQLTKRIVRAPWIAAPPQDNPSQLLRRNNEAINHMYGKYLFESGWIDYVSTYRNIDVGCALTVIDGICYTVKCNGIESIEYIKFYKIPGTIPYLFRITDIGYDFLLPANITKERLGQIIYEEWGDLLKDFDTSKVTSNAEETRRHIVESGISKILDNPLAQQAVELIKQGISRYGVRIDLEVLTDNDTGKQLVCGEVINEYYELHRVVEIAASHIFPDEWIAYTSKAYEILRHIVKGIDGLDRDDALMRVGQYRVNKEVNPNDIQFIWEGCLITGISTSNGLPPDDYLDTLSCLSSWGLMDELRKSGRKDFFKFFLEHITPAAPYVRYRISTYNDQNSGEIWDKLNRYQEIYNINLDSGHVEAMHSTHINQYDSVYENHRAGRVKVNRELGVILTRIGILLAKWFQAHGQPVPEDLQSMRINLMDERRRDREFQAMGINFMVKIKYDKALQTTLNAADSWLASVGLPTLKVMMSHYNSLINYHDPKCLQPVEPVSRYIKIHGITFKSDEIVRLLHNTPIATASQYANEYDPPWLSHRDVRLISDFLNGLVMPHVYYTEMSEEAHIHLSDVDTFFYLYHGVYQMNNTFVLGERFANYFPRYKPAFERGYTRTNEEKTLFSLFGCTL